MIFQRLLEGEIVILAKIYINKRGTFVCQACVVP